MQPSAFFHFLPFLCGIDLGGPASAQARGSKAAISTGQLPSLLSWDPASVLFLTRLWGQGLAPCLLTLMIVIIIINPLPADFGAAAAFAAGRQLAKHIERELKARYHYKDNLI
jgi:hypothetical protein